MAIEVGAEAPEFALASDTEGTIRLSDMRGARVLLYFYPKDSTPGCTTQACDFRDNLAALDRLNVKVLGISRDSLASHAKFREKQGLTFPLLSDPDHAVHALYGAWGEKKNYGRVSVGCIRTTVLIDAEGKVERVWPNVRAKGHVTRLLGILGD